MAHLRVRDATNLDAHVRTVGTHMKAGLQRVASAFPAVFGAPRGMGLMLGLPVCTTHQTKAFVDDARDSEHLLLNGAGDNTLRFVPPLVITEAQIDDMLARLDRVIRRILTQTSSES